MTDAEKLDLALWALQGGRVWLGFTVTRRPGQFVAVQALNPYGRSDVIEGTGAETPWESLRLARAALNARDSRGGGA